MICRQLSWQVPDSVEGDDADVGDGAGEALDVTGGGEGVLGAADDQRRCGHVLEAG
jgi:hypothetical protein